jgi:hypothetical protein
MKFQTRLAVARAADNVTDGDEAHHEPRTTDEETQRDREDRLKETGVRHRMPLARSRENRTDPDCCREVGGTPISPGVQRVTSLGMTTSKHHTPVAVWAQDSL